MNEIKFASHREARDILAKMQKCGGAMIKPFAFYKVFWLVCSEEERNTPQMKSKIRLYTDVFCAICNEYFLIYCTDKHPRTEFYIPEERWEKYYYTQGVIEIAIEYLTKKQLLICGERKLPHKDKPVRTYMINLNMLELFARAAEEIYEEEKAKRRPI